MEVMKSVSFWMKRWLAGGNLRKTVQEKKSIKHKENDQDLLTNVHIAWTQNWIENREDVILQVNGAWKEVKEREVKIISNEDGDIDHYKKRSMLHSKE